MKIEIKEKKVDKIEEAVEVIDGVYHATTYADDERIIIAVDTCDDIFVIDSRGHVLWVEKKNALDMCHNIRKIKSLKIEYEVE